MDGISKKIRPPSRLPEKKNDYKRNFRGRIKIFLLLFFALLLCSVLFIKLRVPAVAPITNNDAATTIPKLGDQGSGDKVTERSLNLAPLPTNNNFPTIADEGIWKNKPLGLFPNKEVMAYTFLRPDPTRSDTITTIVQIDTSVINMSSVAGTKHPGGSVGKPGSGMIPKDVADSGKLIAAFDGGFQYRDGAYGMIVGDTTYLPLKNDLGTVVGYKDGSLKIINYTGQSLGDNVAFIRQNCPILIANGNVAVTDPENKSLWGRIVKGQVGIYTSRSGIGLTKEGNLLFAVGNNLTPITLADALKAAGAINAIQLDINPEWVRFNIFESISQGKYSSTTLTKDMHDGSKAYLNGYTKDFFYLYAK
jgi:hypothetical protein